MARRLRTYRAFIGQKGSRFFARDVTVKAKNIMSAKRKVKPFRDENIKKIKQIR